MTTSFEKAKKVSITIPTSPIALLTEGLSLNAIGVYSTICGYHADGSMVLDELYECLPDSIDAINQQLSELVRHGYVEVE